MIKKLYIKNFKAFEDQIFEFKPLTLLTGLNSSGKSSVLQSLLLLRQSYQQRLLNERLALNGNLVNIGTAKDALFEGAKELIFEITLTDNDTSQWSFDKPQELSIDTLPIRLISNNENIYKFSLFNNNFHYLQAERIGARVSYQMSSYQVEQLKQLGSRGEYTAHFLAINAFKSIPHEKLSHPNVKKTGGPTEVKPSDELIHQVEAWMGEISPGTNIYFKLNTDVDLVNLKYKYGDSNFYRSTNVGFGITYTLPIIVAILSSPKDSLILLENPEAHLHPQGQSKMGELIAIASSCGIQIIVETHSDHLLNGIRKAVRHNKINAQDIQIHYFQKYLKKGEAITEIISPRIYQDGGIDKWPDGFFDQAEKDLMELL